MLLLSDMVMNTVEGEEGTHTHTPSKDGWQQPRERWKREETEMFLRRRMTRAGRRARMQMLHLRREGKGGGGGGVWS